MEQLIGTVERIVFSNEETGFIVAYLRQNQLQDPLCIVGNFTSLHPGEILTCEGKWDHHNAHGRRFLVSTYSLAPPGNTRGIQKYLESGMVKGIGKTYAQRIVERFGMTTLEIIAHSPEELAKVEGIGVKRAATISASFQEQQSIREVMLFLKTHNVGTALAKKIFRRYGEESIAILQKDPFVIAKDLFGVGFKTADKIAFQLGFSHDTPTRIIAGLEYVLKELSNEGHVCYPEELLIHRSALILEVDQAYIHKGLLALEEERRIIRKDLLIDGYPVLCVWLKIFYLAETGIAKEIRRLQNAPCIIRPVEEQKALEWIEAKIHLKLSQEQKKALLTTLTTKMHIITGGPGTGKTTITRAILGIHEKLTTKILLTAPTGRAAKRLSEITRKKAFTIHALLEFDFKNGGFKKGKDFPLSCDLIIIDEASMIDTLLMFSLLKAIPAGTRVIIIGDIDQLPSVGPGNVLKDLIEGQYLSTTRLFHIFRQGKHSRIVYNAHQINRGLFPDLPSLDEQSDFYFIPGEDTTDILHTILSLNIEILPSRFSFHPTEDIQVLAPMRKGIIGIENLNAVLQKKLNPAKDFFSSMGRSFAVGDKVMQIRNNYNKAVFNGDVGRVIAFDSEAALLQVEFDQKVIEYESIEVEELVLAYAVSIHKYQGSECPCIIIPVHTSHCKLLYKNLLYTGITRGKKLVVLVGSKKAIAMALRNKEVQERYTGLSKPLFQKEYNRPPLAVPDTPLLLPSESSLDLGIP